MSAMGRGSPLALTKSASKQARAIRRSEGVRAGPRGQVALFAFRAHPQLNSARGSRPNDPARGSPPVPRCGCAIAAAGDMV
jgi:hypothetical protein